MADWIDPDLLEPDWAQVDAWACSECSEPIGHLLGEDDSTGCFLTWREVYVGEDGRKFCEDCAGQELTMGQAQGIMST